MTDSSTCPVCEQPIRLDDFVYIGPERRMMEPLRCHAVPRGSDISVEADDASADAAFGPMS